MMDNNKTRNFLKDRFIIISFCTAGLGIVFLVIYLLTKGKIDLTLPYIFFLLSFGFFLILQFNKSKWQWINYLYTTVFLFFSFGLIFLLNVLTGDWNSWAFAWLLLVASIGLGLIFAISDKEKQKTLNFVGSILFIVGITFFCVFGVIAGGLVIKIISPVLVIIGSLILYKNYYGVKPLENEQEPKIGGSIQQDKPFHDNRLVESLSDRELSVLKLISEGLTNQQIALTLSLATSTVKTHINNIYGKLGVQTRTQAIRKAADLHLFTH